MLRKDLVKVITDLAALRLAAQTVVNRWDSPKWKTEEGTAVSMNKLRKALEKINYLPNAGGQP
jgi:hypothetical protein